MLRELHSTLRQLRIALQSTIKSVPSNYRQWCRYWESYRAYERLAPPDAPLNRRIAYPCLGDDTSQTQIEPVYFYQDSWAFEKIVQNKPPWHLDVGSHHKFIALLSKVLPVTMVDLRPLSLPLESLHFKEGTILALPYADGSVPSVSSICVIEHIGLGRYGDPLDPLGSEKSLAELKRVVEPGGSLYISVPLDDENRIYFNAHRAFTEDYLLKKFEPFQVLEKRYIYGYEFGKVLKRGFGTGCYHLKAPG